MIHFTCDGCRRQLDAGNELRYVVRLEVYAALDPLEEELDDDRDHLQEIQDILERMDDSADERIGDDVYRQMRFDLCPACRKRMLASPLGQASPKQFDFSEN